MNANKAISWTKEKFLGLNSKYGTGWDRVKPLARVAKDAGEGFNPHNMTWKQRAKMLAMNDEGQYSARRIAAMGAAGYMGVSAAGRITSGGGLYKDADGNTDIIGIPFI